MFKVRIRRVHRRSGAANGEAIYALIALVFFFVRCLVVAIAFVVGAVAAYIRARRTHIAPAAMPDCALMAMRPILTRPLNTYQIGKQFELDCAQRLIRAGWLVRHIGGSGDRGADLIGTRNGSVLVMQCKCYAQAVGTRAVQEAHTAGAYHRASITAVVAKNDFTVAARHIAGKVGVKLVNVNDLSGI